MTLETQVASLDLSKKLKELGYPQEGLFHWCKRAQISLDLNQNMEPNFIFYDLQNDEYKEYVSPICVAPTVAELGEWLPMIIRGEDGDPHGMMFGNADDTFAPAILKGRNKRYKVFYEDMVVDDEIIGFVEENEADARAKMLIWLMENEYVDFEDKKSVGYSADHSP